MEVFKEINSKMLEQERFLSQFAIHNQYIINT